MKVIAKTVSFKINLKNCAEQSKKK